MTIGQRIKQYRTAAGLTQTDLAASIKVSKQTLYKYENDIITNIPSDKIELIAKTLGVTPADIMGWIDSTSGNNTDSGKIQLMTYYDSFNETGKNELLRYAKLMNKDESYKRGSSDSFPA